jgi:hypothetical protein
MLKPKRKVDLLSIDFRWDQLDSSQSAMAVLPETAGWTPDHRSFTAYSISEIKDVVEGGKLKIRARFQKSTAGGRIQVRTKYVPIRMKDIFTGEILEQYPGEEALGNVKPTTIFFNDTSYSIYRGKYTHVPLTLEGVRFPELGVGIYDINWRWEYRKLNTSKTTDKEDVWQNIWHPFQVTQHRVFVVLDKPNFPWTPHGMPDYSKGAPYPLPLKTEALYFACEWARGAATKEEAAKMITDKLHDSGRFVYDVNPHYFEEKVFAQPGFLQQESTEDSTVQMGYFHLLKALERLSGGHGFGEKANCVDCACLVTALSNLLGCNLQVGKLQHSSNTDTADPDFFTDNRFEVNPIRAIGHADTEQTMAGLIDDDKHYFAFHAVAFQVDGTEDSPGEFGAAEMRVYDACVAFAAENSGDAETPNYFSAADLPFQDSASPCYQHLLAADTEEGRPFCLPQKATVVRMQMC